jgi:hypothetical protein
MLRVPILHSCHFSNGIKILCLFLPTFTVVNFNAKLSSSSSVHYRSDEFMRVQLRDLGQIVPLTLKKILP